MDSPTQNTSLQRLQNVEKVIRVLELAGSVMDEFANPTGPRKDYVSSHCAEFMKLIKDIQVTLREEIKSACEYRPFEKCDYSSRISNEVCCKKLDYVDAQLLVFFWVNSITLVDIMVLHVEKRKRFMDSELWELSHYAWKGALTLASVLLYPGTRGGGDVFGGWVPFN